MTESAFFTAAAVIAAAYIGYPLLLWLWACVAPRPVLSGPVTPTVTLIVAARNEERDIAAKLESTLQSDYPRQQLDIIVVSDASTDATCVIVRQFRDRGVSLCEQLTRVGKTEAQQRAAQQATGEILVFTDATSLCAPDAIRHLVRPFADPSVGCVSGRLVYQNGLASAVGEGCINYWSYETQLRTWESRAGSLVGVSGSLYAVRRSAFPRLAPGLIDDLAIASEVHLRGLRTVYAPDAICVEETHSEAGDEFRMRVRIVEQTLRTLAHYRQVFNPVRHGTYAAEMIGHKLLRYIAAPALLVLLAASAAMASTSGWALVVLAGQIALYLAALAGWGAARLECKSVFGLPYYFVSGNVAVLVGWAHFLRGRQYVLWEPVRPARAVPVAERTGR